MISKELLESLGLRDLFSDPEVFKKVKEEKDLNVKYTISTAFATYTANLLTSMLMLCTPEQAQEVIKRFYETSPKGEAAKVLIQILEETNKEIMEEIYKKQREIFSGIDH
jgi:hypothetical protein